jgi:hypothetical protein
MNRIEAALQSALLLRLPYEIPEGRFFTRTIIDRRVADPNTGREYQLKAGSKGMADIFGFVRAGPWAIPIEIELKSHEGRQEPEQKRWQNLMTTSSVPFLLLRQKKAETTKETIDRWILEIKLLISSLRPTPSSSMPPSMQPSTASQAVPRTTSPTPETLSVSSSGSGETSATSRSGTNGSRGIEPAGRNRRSARLRLPFRPPA